MRTGSHGVASLVLILFLPGTAVACWALESLASDEWMRLRLGSMAPHSFYGYNCDW